MKIRSNKKLFYVELKTGYNDCGPAWTGFSSSSKSGATVYFNGLSLKHLAVQAAAEITMS